MLSVWLAAIDLLLISFANENVAREQSAHKRKPLLSASVRISDNFFLLRSCRFASETRTYEQTLEEDEKEETHLFSLHLSSCSLPASKQANQMPLPSYASFISKTASFTTQRETSDHLDAAFIWICGATSSLMINWTCRGFYFYRFHARRTMQMSRASNSNSSNNKLQCWLVQTSRPNDAEDIRSNLHTICNSPIYCLCLVVVVVGGGKLASNLDR